MIHPNGFSEESETDMTCSALLQVRCYNLFRNMKQNSIDQNFSSGGELWEKYSRLSDMPSRVRFLADYRKTILAVQDAGKKVSKDKTEEYERIEKYFIDK